MDLLRRPNRDDIANAIHKVNERDSTLLGMLPEDFASWLIAFVVPYALAVSSGEARRPQTLVEALPTKCTIQVHVQHR